MCKMLDPLFEKKFEALGKAVAMLVKTGKVGQSDAISRIGGIHEIKDIISFYRWFLVKFAMDQHMKLEMMANCKFDLDDYELMDKKHIDLYIDCFFTGFLSLIPKAA